VKNVVVILCGSVVLLNGEGVLPGEAIMDLPDEVRIADGPSFVLGRHAHREVPNLGELIADVYLVGLVHDDGEDGLGGASVVDHLVREKESGVGVLHGLTLLRVGYPLEQENQAEDGPVRKLVNRGLVTYFI
jgi:hypothetical protein